MFNRIIAGACAVGSGYNMKILIVKMSSMGDIIHTLPAVTDAMHFNKDFQFDWVVEKSFAEIPSWHSGVRQVIPIELRAWRKDVIEAITTGAISNFLKKLRLEKYDCIIDAQGLIKSAIVARLAQGKRCGLDYDSAWEPLATYLYQKKCTVNPELHAITRVRLLFSKILGYEFSAHTVDYGLNKQGFIKESFAEKPYVLLLHGTTWATKHWPDACWKALVRRINEAGFVVKLPWSNEVEKTRATNIASISDSIEILPRLNLAGMAKVIAGSTAVVAVDTGLGHLTAALNVPSVSLYGITDANEIGTIGAHQIHLQSETACATSCTQQQCVRATDTKTSPACLQAITPDRVWEALKSFL